MMTQFIFLPMLWIFIRFPKYLHKPCLDRFIQLIQLLLTFRNQVAHFVQNRRDFALFVNGWKGNFCFRKCFFIDGLECTSSTFGI